MHVSIWCALLIPFIATAILCVFFRRQVVWWEIGVPLVASFFTIMVCKFTAESAMSQDTEYWGGWITRVEYTEPWDEKVSCRHPVYCTRMVLRTYYTTHYTGTGSNRRSRRTSHTKLEPERYRCGWEHSFDVDYHAATFSKYGSNGEHFDISQAEFEGFVSKNQNKRKIDLSRNYYKIDGDKYVSEWDKQDSTIDILTTTHSYENRVQVSELASKYKEVPPEKVRQYSLHSYPEISGGYCPSVLGGGPNFGEANQYLNIWNAKYGASKQARIWILFYKNCDSKTATLQESYWRGGNKNEIVVAVCADDSNNFKWAHVFSWTEVPDFNKTLLGKISGGESHEVDLLAIAKDTADYVKTNWVRKSFKEYSYLTVVPSTKAIVWTFVITLLVNIGVSLFVIMNGFDNPEAPYINHPSPIKPPPPPQRRFSETPNHSSLQSIDELPNGPNRR